MPTKPSDKGAAQHEDVPTPEKRYRVLSGGITSQTGRPVVTYYKGAIVTAEELGDAGRVAKLHERKAIEEVTGDAAE